MDEIIRVYLYQGTDLCQDVDIPRSEFERALDALFSDETEAISIRVDQQEVCGVTDLILAGVGTEHETGSAANQIEDGEGESSEEFDLAA